MKRLACILLILFVLSVQALLAQEARNTPKRRGGHVHMPELSTPPATFKVDYYLRAAIALQKLPKGRAIQILSGLAKSDDYHDAVFVLCRMLFTPKGNTPFRRPGIGGPWFLSTKADAVWPLEPIALVDGIPFRIVSGYILGGMAESSADYLRYCLRNCNWNPMKFELKGKAAKQQALETLLAAHTWNTEPEAREFLSAQIH